MTCAARSGPAFRPLFAPCSYEGELASERLPREAAREAWQRVIDQTLIEWGRQPEQLEDEGIRAPSRNAIRLATHLARILRDDAVPAPTRVVPDGEGGLSFEREDAPYLESFNVLESGRIELEVYEDCRLIRSSVLDFPEAF